VSNRDVMRAMDLHIYVRILFACCAIHPCTNACMASAFFAIRVAAASKQRPPFRSAQGSQPHTVLRPPWTAVSEQPRPGFSPSAVHAIPVHTLG
jgi:hypothetical protein